MYKTNEYYLEEMLENIRFILEHMNGITKEALAQDEVLTDSMIFRLIQISESSKICQMNIRKNMQMFLGEI